MKLNKAILRNLLPGLLPLFIYILADSVWGTVIALYIAIGFGFVELLFTYIIYGKFEKFIISDIGLLIILGGISIFLENDIFFKLKPALIELIFAAILGFSAFSRRNIIFEMSLRYLKDVQISRDAERKLNSSLKAVFYLTLGHIILVLYSAFYMSDEAWAFIGGALFYILILGYFAFEMIKNRRQKKLPGEEKLPVVDESGNVVGSANRSDCHFKEVKLLHPVVHMHIFNSKGELFLQHRSKMKKVQPDKWDTAVGGHISFGETLELALNRETSEEAGLSSFKAQFIERYIWDTDIEKELVYTFYSITDKELFPEQGESIGGKFWKKEEIIKNLGKEIFTPNFEKEFELLLKNIFK